MIPHSSLRSICGVWQLRNAMKRSSLASSASRLTEDRMLGNTESRNRKNSLNSVTFAGSRAR